MSNPGIFKTRTSGGAIARYRVVKHGAADHVVLQAAAATDPLCGVTQELGASAASQRIDICMGGMPEIEYGGIVTRGDPLTSDNLGRAVKAEPAAGANVRIIGWADASGVAGDIHAIQFAPGQIQG